MKFANTDFEFPNKNPSKVSIDNYIFNMKKILNNKLKLEDSDSLPVLRKHYNPNYIFRIRSYENSKKINEINYYSHPKPNKTGINRTNLPFYPVFYGALNPKTGLKEFSKHYNSEQLTLISKWKLKAPISFSPIIPDKFNKQAEDIFNQFKDNKIKIFTEFLGNQIISENNKYWLSSLLSHIILYENNTDMISYPCSLDLSGINFAIHPRVLEKGILMLEKVYEVKFNLETNECSLTRIGICNEHLNIEWFNINDIKNNSFWIQEFIQDFKI